MLFLCCFDAARFFFARALSFIRHTYLRAEDCSIWVRLGGRDFDRNSTDGGFAICQISVKFLSVFWMPLWPLLGSFGFPRRSGGAAAGAEDCSIWVRLGGGISTEIRQTAVLRSVKFLSNFCRYFGCLCGHCWALLGSLGAVSRLFGCPLGHFGGYFGDFGQLWATFWLAFG